MEVCTPFGNETKNALQKSWQLLCEIGFCVAFGSQTFKATANILHDIYCVPSTRSDPRAETNKKKRMYRQSVSCTRSRMHRVRTTRILCDFISCRTSVSTTLHSERLVTCAHPQRMRPSKRPTL